MPVAVNTIARRAAARWGEFRGYTPTDRNLFYLCIEIIPIGLASGALSFNGPFVLKLGASNALIGAMSSLPALVVILLTVPAARFIETRRNKRPWVVSSLGVSRLLYLLIALVPWLVPAEYQAAAIVGLIILQQVPLAFFNTSFWTLISDVCPPDRRSSLFATRTVFLAASVAASAFVSGLFLDQLPTPLNYQILNLIGFALAQVSTYYVGKVQFPAPDEHPYPKPVDPAAGQRAPGLSGLNRGVIRSFVQEHRPYVHFNITTLVCWIGAWGAGPLYTIFLVRELQFTNSWIGANSTLAQLAVMLSAPLWNRLIRRKGNLWVVLRSVVLTGLYPLLVVLLPHPVPLLGVGFVNTLNDTGLGIAHTAIFLDVIPPARRSTYIAIHTTLMNVGAMIAPLVTTPLASAIGVTVVLLMCAAVRTAGGLLFWVLPPTHRKPAPASPAPSVPA